MRSFRHSSSCARIFSAGLGIALSLTSFVGLVRPCERVILEGEIEDGVPVVVVEAVRSSPKPGLGAEIGSGVVALLCSRHGFPRGADGRAWMPQTRSLVNISYPAG